MSAANIIQYRWKMNEYKALVARYRRGKTEILAEKPIPALLYPLKISLELI